MSVRTSTDFAAVGTSPAEAGEGGVGEAACIRCGYSLIGLDPRRPCPECGLLVGMSLIRSDELRHARAGWLLNLIRGAAITSAGILLAPGALLALVLVYVDVPLRTGSFPLDQAIVALLGFLPLALLAAGVCLLTTKPRNQREVRGCGLFRGLAAGLILIYVITAACAIFSTGVATSIKMTMMIVGVCGFLVIAAPLAVVAFKYMHYLAQRVPAPRLAGDSPVFGWLFAASLLLPCAFILVQLIGGPRISTTLSLLLLASIGTLVPLTWIWSVYLLIRYAIAFGRTISQSRQLMRPFDAAETGGVDVAPLNRG